MYLKREAEWSWCTLNVFLQDFMWGFQSVHFTCCSICQTEIGMRVEANGKYLIKISHNLNYRLLYF